MKQRYLEVTFRKGKPLAAYFYLPRKSGDHSIRTERHEGGLVVDFAEDGRAIGVEITAPNKLDLAVFNRVLAAVTENPVTQADVQPLVPA
jgi:uncharacterized protein YuzE